MGLIWSFNLLGPSLTFLIFSLQLFGLQTIGEACNSALGLENGNIPDSHISASSFLPYFFIERKHKDMKPKYARLRNRYAWCTYRDRRQWLKVDLGKVTYVNAISSQGFQGAEDYHVTTYELAYSIDGTNWKFVSENNTIKVFSGNIHGVDIKKNSFGQIQARYVKFIPLTYHIRICLRLELFGCFKELSPSTSISSNLSKSMSRTLATSTPTIGHPNFQSSSTPSLTTGIPQSISSTQSYPTTGTPQPISSTLSPSTGTPQFISSTQSHPTTGRNTPVIQSSTTVTPQPISTLSHLTEGTPTFASAPISSTVSTLINALHRSGYEEKRKKLVIGLIIFTVLFFLVVSPLLVYLVVKKRKRQANYRCQFQVDLPWNSSQIDVVPLESASECENQFVLVNFSCDNQLSYCDTK